MHIIAQQCCTPLHFQLDPHHEFRYQADSSINLWLMSVQEWPQEQNIQATGPLHIQLELKNAGGLLALSQMSLQAEVSTSHEVMRSKRCCLACRVSGQAL